MPNQRKKGKRNVTITLDDELFEEVKKWAEENNYDLTNAIKHITETKLKLKTKYSRKKNEIDYRPDGK